MPVPFSGSLGLDMHYHTDLHGYELRRETVWNLSDTLSASYGATPPDGAFGYRTGAVATQDSGTGAATKKHLIYFDSAPGADISIPRTDCEENWRAAQNFNGYFTVPGTNKITNLNADLLDGYNTSTTAVQSTIPVYSTGGTLFVAAPTLGGHAVNKTYADALGAGINPATGGACRVATTAAVPNLSNASVTIDGLICVEGDRVLVKNQASPDGIVALSNAYDGIYVVGVVSGGTAAFTRATDSDETTELDRQYVLVIAGSTNIGKSFFQTTNDPVVDTDALNYVLFYSPVAYVAGNGINLTGTTFSVLVSGSTTYTAGGILYHGSTSTISSVQLTGMLKGTGATAPTAVTGTQYGATYWSDANTIGTTLAPASATVVLHGNPAGAPTWSQIVGADIAATTIDLTTKVTGILPLANGGTNANLTAVNGGLVWSTATAFAITAALTGVLKGNGAAAPTAMTGTQFAATYWTDANTIGSVALNATATNKFLRQVSSGAPTFEQVLAADIGSGAALTKADDTNVTLTLGGTPTTALLVATSLTLGWTGTLSVPRGGTGAGTFTSNGVLYGNSTSAIQVTAQGGANTVLVANAGAPSFSGQPTLATGIITKGQEAVRLDPYNTLAGNTGELRFLELAVNGVNYVGFKAADAIVASLIWILPSADGSANHYLKTSGAGVLSFAQIASTELNNSTFVTSVSGTADRITSTGGLTPVIDIAATYVGQTSITTLGTITTGTWNATIIGVQYGGTAANLSATGGAGQYLKQSSIGGAITVGTIPSGDVVNSTFVTSVSGTADRITSTGGLTPVIDIAATYIGQTSITTLGIIATGTWSATTISIAKGGTGQTTASAAFNALSPMTTLGDTIYGGASGAGTRLAGNITTTKKYLSQTGDTVNSAAPAWAQIASADIANSLFVTSVSGTADRITSSGGLTPIIDIAATYVGQTSITTLGTITTGVWNGTDIAFANITQIATARILGRNTAGTGDIEELTAATVKTMLSLNNVENTALSTWAGTTNITTLGTITTGVWNATVIGVTYGGTGATTLAGAGIVTGAGSGAANRVTFWSDANTLSSSANLTWDGSKLGISGAANVILLSGAAIGSQYLRATSTGGDLLLGLENNAGGGLLTGTTAYAACLASLNSTPLHLGTNSIVRWTVAAASNTLSGNGVSQIDASNTLTIATTANNGNILLMPHGTGNVNITQTTGRVMIESYAPILHLYENDTSTNHKRWQLKTVAGNFFGQALSDDELTTTTWLQVNRTTTTIDSITLSGTVLNVSYLTSKSVLFAGASGAVSQDNSNFQYDSTALFDTRFSLIGASTNASSKLSSLSHTGAIIGAGYTLYVTKTGASTTNVAGYFSASGATNNYGLIVENGNVGIGTTGPDYALDVNGVVASSRTGTTNVYFRGGGGPDNPTYITRVELGIDTWHGYMSLYDSADAKNVHFNASGNSYINGGNVGIGQTVPLGPLHIKAATPQIFLEESDAAADNKLWDWYVNAEQLSFRAVNDANAVQTSWMTVDRTGTTVDLVTFPNSPVRISSLTASQLVFTDASKNLVSGTNIPSGTTIGSVAIARKYAAYIGNGVDNAITVTHSLNTLDVVVYVYNIATGQQAFVKVVNDGVNTVTVTFGAAPAASSYRIVVIG